MPATTLEHVTYGTGATGDVSSLTGTGGIWRAVRVPDSMRPVPTEEPYWLRLRRMRLDAGLSQEALFKRSDGISYETLRALERDPSQPVPSGSRSRARYPSPEMLERAAEALGVDPSVFAEYRLAKAREELDERVAGLDKAVDNLDRVVSALVAQSVRRRPRANADGQQGQHRPALRAILDEGRNG